MRIITKNENNPGKPTLFIFEFINKEDFDDYIKGLKFYTEIEAIIPDISVGLNNIINDLISRTDDKYAREGCELSSMLFCSEMAAFTLYLSMLAAIKY